MPAKSEQVRGAFGFTGVRRGRSGESRVLLFALTCRAGSGAGATHTRACYGRYGRGRVWRRSLRRRGREMRMEVRERNNLNFSGTE
jgi:hypothetical protein